MRELGLEIFAAVWIFLPAAAANVAPILLAKLPGLRCLGAPLDFGRKFRGRAIFGPHKTWRGLIGGIAAATLTVWLQLLIASGGGWLRGALAGTGFNEANFWLVGPLFALGALGGDAVESFIKRRAGKRPGQTWPFFDQVDYVLGALLLTWPCFHLHLWQYAVSLAFYTLLSFIFSLIGIKIRFKKSV